MTMHVSAPPPRSPEAKPRSRRAERHEDTSKRLFAAAIKIVGQYGYAGASVARITEEAGIAQGTFYLHFENRQALLDQLLPAVSQEIIGSLRAREYRALSAQEREIERLRVFFEIIQEVPAYLRVLTEAEHFAPESYRRQLAEIVTDYARVLKAESDPNSPDAFSDAEWPVIVHILLMLRTYLGKHFCGPNGVGPVPEHAISAYAKLVRRGLFPVAEQFGNGRV